MSAFVVNLKMLSMITANCALVTASLGLNEPSGNPLIIPLSYHFATTVSAQCPAISFGFANTGTERLIRSAAVKAAIIIFLTSLS